MARQNQEKQDWEGAMDLILGGVAHLKINNHGSSLLLPPPPPKPSSLSSVRVTTGILCLEINKLAPLSAWDFPLSGDTHRPPPERRGFFPAAGELWGKEGGLVAGRTLINCPLLSSCWYLDVGIWGGLEGVALM